MSWDAYLTTLIDKTICTDAAIYSSEPPHAPWATRPGSVFSQITPHEFSVITCKDRSSLFINGLTVGGKKCSMIRDQLVDEGTMDIRTKCSDGPTYNICIIKTNQTFIFLLAGEGVHGGALNQRCFGTVTYLKNSGY